MNRKRMSIFALKACCLQVVLLYLNQDSQLITECFHLPNGFFSLKNQAVSFKNEVNEKQS